VLGPSNGRLQTLDAARRRDQLWRAGRDGRIPRAARAVGNAWRNPIPVVACHRAIRSDGHGKVRQRPPGRRLLNLRRVAGGEGSEDG
jgi:hypothetical protein